MSTRPTERGPFLHKHEDQLPAKTAVSVVLVFFVALGLRALDALVLLRWPRLWWAFVKIGARGLLESPYDEGGFERVAAAKQAGLSARALTYGETTVRGARAALLRAGARAGDRVLDLGAGRGRVLLAARSLGCHATGVELLGGHVAPVAETLRKVGIELRQGDAAEEELSGASVLYLTWTCFSETARDRMTRHLQTADAGTVVLTTSWPVTGSGFEPLWEETRWFSWGRATLYAQRRSA